mgnify:CR=1 FL=1
MQNQGLLLRIPDKLLFWLLWLIHLLPVWMFTPFPTVDGPAHLYNARLMLELWRGNPTVSEFFVLNPLLQPNVLGHVLLAGMMALGLPALLAEKLLLTTLVGLLPLAFRRLIRSLNPDAGDVALLVFPFVYGFLFFMGLYNFLLGLVMLLFGIEKWINLVGKAVNRRDASVLIVVALLTLYAHLYAFVWFLVFTALVLMADRFGKEKSLTNKQMAIKILVWGLPLLPALYHIIRGKFSGGDTVFASPSALWDLIYQVQPAKGLEYGKANIYTQWLFWLLVLRLAVSVYEAIKKGLRPETTLLRMSFLLLSIALFALPDGTALSGMVSQRTGLLWFFSLLALLAAIPAHSWLRWTSRAVALVVCLSLLWLYNGTLKREQTVARSVALAARSIPAGAVVYVENTSSQMLNTHVSNYLGAGRPLIVSENYQAALPYFPVGWNLRNLPVLHLGEMSKHVKAWPVAGGLRNLRAAYVLVISDGSSDPATEGILDKQHYFRGLYELIYQDQAKRVSLFRALPLSIYDL